MRQRVLCAAVSAFIAALLGAGVLRGQDQRPPQPQAATSYTPPKTPWGDPDLQGIWTFQFQVPLERPKEYAGKEFFTDEEIAKLDEERSQLGRRDARPATSTRSPG